MPWLIVVLSVIEYYSAGVAVLAKRKEKKYWWLNLIPFVAFFYVQEYTRGFKIVMIPVKKWGQTVLIFAAVALVAVLLGEASEGRFIEEQVKYIKEITYIPIAAYVLAKKDLAGRKALNIFFMIPMFFGGGMIPLYLVIRGIKIYDTVWALIFPCAVRISNVLLLRNYFYGIPTSLNEAGELDGANQFQILIKIIIPLAVPMMLTIGMIMFVDRWNNWLDTLLYFGSSNTKWWTIQYVLRQILTDMQSLYGSLGGGSIVDAPLISARNAAVVIAVLPLVCLSPVLHKYYIKGMTEGAVKG